MPRFGNVGRDIGPIVEVRGINRLGTCSWHAHTHQSRLHQRVVKVTAEVPKCFRRVPVIAFVKDSESDKTISAPDHNSRLPAKSPSQRAHWIGQDIGSIATRITGETRRGRSINNPLIWQHTFPLDPVKRVSEGAQRLVVGNAPPDLADKIERSTQARSSSSTNSLRWPMPTLFGCGKRLCVRLSDCAGESCCPKMESTEPWVVHSALSKNTFAQ